MLDGKAKTRRKSLNDSLDGDIRGFLINESELHTYDDLTKVNPVTPNTGTVCMKAIRNRLLLKLRSVKCLEKSSNFI